MSVRNSWNQIGKPVVYDPYLSQRISGRVRRTPTYTDFYRRSTPTTRRRTKTKTVKYKNIISETKRAFEEAKAANEKRYQDILAKRQAAVAAQNAAFQNLLQNTSAGWGGLTNRINAEQLARERKAMGMLEGAGQQEAADIRESWRQRSAQTQQRLRSSGLGNTTIGAAMAQGAMRGERGSLGRLQERLRREKLGLYTGLTGERINALGGNLRGGLAATTALGTMGIRAGYGGASDTANFMERRTDAYPDYAQSLALLAQQAQYGNGYGGGSYGGGGYARTRLGGGYSAVRPSGRVRFGDKRYGVDQRTWRERQQGTGFGRTAQQFRHPAYMTNPFSPYNRRGSTAPIYMRPIVYR